jgi:hypothetical protein
LRRGFGTHAVSLGELRDAFRTGWIVEATEELNESGHQRWSASAASAGHSRPMPQVSQWVCG